MSAPAQATPASAARDVVVGVALMASATQLQPMMDAVAKYLGGQISPLQVAWGRMFFQMLFTLPAALVMHGAARLVPGNILLQSLRGLMLAGMNVTFFFAIAAMPLADAIALVFIAPLVVTALSALVLGENVGPRRWTAVAIGLIGAAIVIRPGSGVFSAVSLLPLATALCYASYLIVTRKLSGSARPMQTHFFTSLSCTLILTMPLIVGGAAGAPAFTPVWPEPAQWGLLALIGLISTVAHLFIILGYGRAPASVLAPISFLEIVGATIIGYLAFGDFPDAWTFVGVAIIVMSGLYVVLRERGAAVSPRMHGRRTGGGP